MSRPDRPSGRAGGPVAVGPGSASSRPPDGCAASFAGARAALVALATLVGCVAGVAVSAMTWITQTLREGL